MLILSDSENVSGEGVILCLVSNFYSKVRSFVLSRDQVTKIPGLYRDIIIRKMCPKMMQILQEIPKQWMGNNATLTQTLLFEFLLTVPYMELKFPSETRDYCSSHALWIYSLYRKTIYSSIICFKKLWYASTPSHDTDATRTVCP